MLRLLPAPRRLNIPLELVVQRSLVEGQLVQNGLIESPEGDGSLIRLPVAD